MAQAEHIIVDGSDYNKDVGDNYPRFVSALLSSVCYVADPVGGI